MKNKLTTIILIEILFCISLTACGANNVESTQKQAEETSQKMEASNTSEATEAELETEISTEIETETEESVTDESISETESSTDKSGKKKSKSGSGTSASTDNNTSTQQEAYFDRDKAVAVFNMVNAERAANGLNQLTWDEGIYNFACIRATEIVSDFSHGGSLNGSPYGENIEWASWVRSADEIHDSWYNSPGHHSNYLNANYGSMAVAVYVNENGCTYAVENFALSQAYAPISEVGTWTASNGVVVTIFSDGSICFNTCNTDDISVAEAEYYACH